MKSTNNLSEGRESITSGASRRKPSPGWHTDCILAENPGRERFCPSIETVSEYIIVVLAAEFVAICSTAQKTNAPAQHRQSEYHGPSVIHRIWDDCSGQLGELVSNIHG